MFNASATPGGATNVHIEYAIQVETPDTEVIVLSVILGVFCILGTVGNALAFIIYYRKREKGTSTIFILSLAVTDFLTCLVNIPYTITALLLEYRFEYDFLCKIFLYIATFNVPLSSLIMVAIGIDRYLCICHPFLHIVTVPRSKVCVIILTLVSALQGIIPAMSHATYRHLHSSNDTLTSHSPNLTPVSLPRNDSAGFSTPNSTRSFTSGLFLAPADEFVNGVIWKSAEVNYRTDNSDLVSSTPSTNFDVSLSNATTFILSPIITRMYINKSSDAYYDGVCVESEDILSKQFVSMYLRIYASTYLFEFIILALLYALIYRSILVRRAWKTKRKRMSCYASTHYQETVAEETQLTNINGGATETVVLKKNHGRFSSAMRDRTLHANIKTAAMLFVVTVGFVISFLPSWMMGLRILPFQVSVFYMFYINNMINPFIYAFMNRTFRDDLFQLLKNIIRR